MTTSQTETLTEDCETKPLSEAHGCHCEERQRRSNLGGSTRLLRSARNDLLPERQLIQFCPVLLSNLGAGLGNEQLLSSPFSGDAFPASRQDLTPFPLCIRAAILGEGKGVFREIQLDQTLDTSFQAVPIAGEYAETVNKALRALDTLPESGIYRAARVNLSKRLLDYVKLDAAVDTAVKAVQSGHRVPVFISNVSPFNFGNPEDDSIKDLGKITQQIRQAFAAEGLTGTLPSPVQHLVTKLRERLGNDAVEAYTGEVSEGKREKIKNRFNKGDLKVIVATIAAGGTGLSLHDTQGNAPRTQINVGLPWSGKDFQQLLGRTYRMGTKTPVQQHFIVADHPDDQRVAKLVAGKVESMGATTRGITADRNVENLARFSLFGSFEPDDQEEDDSMSKGLTVFVLPIRRTGVWLLVKSSVPTGGKNDNLSFLGRKAQRNQG